MSTLRTNRDVYQIDPSQRKLENQGVANVNDDKSAERLAVLEYELETFVCSGQYAQGLDKILGSFLANVNKAEQPAVWVSGFYGSGKSHLVKMLRALWVNQEFQDTRKARDIADLPQDVRDRLRELDVVGTRSGGLHAASGTLGAGSDQSVRLALLGIVFKSKGLPEDYSAASLVLWLMQEGKLEEVKAHLAAGGRTLDGELEHMYMSGALHEALVASFPEMYTDAAACGSRLETQFRPREDVTSDEMVQAIRRTLAGEAKQIPLTLIVLDEVQQYIGTNEDRSIDVQEALEAVSKRFAGRLLFIATGQAALTAIDKIKKLEGRFTVRVQLRDEDVDEVVRKVVLEKKPTATPVLEGVYSKNVGELSKHLANTQLGKQPRDADDFPRDYPILPARRRFWEHALRALDATSVKSQLRNQLGLTHKVVQTNLDQPIGHVVPADALYFEQAPSLVLSHVLPRRVHEFTTNGENSEDPNVRTTARAVGVVYLINQIKKDKSAIALGLRADVNTVADLLVSDLDAGSASLRAELPGLLRSCELLDEIDGEFVIQTKESAEWRDRFQAEVGNLGGNTVQIQSERDERIRRAVGEELRKIEWLQGQANVRRSVPINTDEEAPTGSADKLLAWVPGLRASRSEVEGVARAAGTESPMLFVHLELGEVDALRQALIEYKAADITINSLAASDTAEGRDARKSIETRRTTAGQRIDNYIQQAIAQARVYQGGGTEITGEGLRSLVTEGAERSVLRLYPKFAQGDHADWGKVLDVARRGSSDALSKVGHRGEVHEHPVAAAILKSVASARTGKELHAEFEGAPYGWPSDAIDGALLALVQAGQVAATSVSRDAVKLENLTKTEIGRSRFKSESTVVQTQHRLAGRGVYSLVGLNGKSGNELDDLPDFFTRLDDLAQRAGGEPPLPAVPRLPNELRAVRDAGSPNERLVGLAGTQQTWRDLIADWTARAELAERRTPAYDKLERLLAHVEKLPASAERDDLLTQAEALRTNRQLLSDADPTASLTKTAEQLLREALAQRAKEYDAALAQGMERWQTNAYYESLTPEQRHDVLEAQGLTASQRPSIAYGNTEEVLATLRANSLEQLATRAEVLPMRFDKAFVAAKRLATPDAPVARRVHLERRELRTEAEIDAWLEVTGEQLRQHLRAGDGAPVRPD